MPIQIAPLFERKSLFGVLSEIRGRPGMFFGDTRVEHCWALVRGFEDAEAESGVDSDDSSKLRMFQAWVDQRYPFGKGIEWFKVFRLLAVSPSRGCEVFFGELDLFVSGRSPDSPSSIDVRMMEAILKERG